MLLSQILTSRGRHVASLGKSLPIDLEGGSVTDRWTDGGRMSGRKNIIAPAYPYHEESHIEGLVKFRPLVYPIFSVIRRSFFHSKIFSKIYMCLVRRILIFGIDLEEKTSFYS